MLNQLPDQATLVQTIRRLQRQGLPSNPTRLLVLVPEDFTCRELPHKYMTAGSEEDEPECEMPPI